MGRDDDDYYEYDDDHALREFTLDTILPYARKTDRQTDQI